MPVFDTTMIVVTIIFVLTYSLMLVFAQKRVFFALGGAIVLLVLGLTGFIPNMSLQYLFLEGINWNVLMMLFGTMGLVSLFIDTGMPALIADKILDRSPNYRFAIISLALFAGVVSAFIDNVATVLMIAPIVFDAAKKAKANPVNAIIAIAVASNLEGAATLVGDTTSILLGGYMGLNFADFFWFLGKPSLFFYNQIGLVLGAVVLLFVFRKEKQSIVIEEKTKVTDFVPSYLMLLLLLALIVASFLPIEFPLINGVICLAIMIIGLVYEIARSHNGAVAKKAIKEVDYQTLTILLSIFVIVAALSQSGIVDWIGQGIAKVSNSNLFIAYTIIVWVSVIISAFIDNIPYVAMMLGVVKILGITFAGDGATATEILRISTPLYFGLLCGATLGGNLTPIGASANVAAIGLLRKKNYSVSTGQFMKIGVPFTLIATFSAYVLVWLFFGLGL